MRKLLSVGALMLCAVGFTAAAPAQAQSAAPTSAHETRSSVLPWEGHYRGLDADHRTVTFTYSRAHGITHFRVGHTVFPNSRVSGSQWHHTCHGGYCTRGQWHHDFFVTGHWNVTHSGGDVFFEATHVS